MIVTIKETLDCVKCRRVLKNAAIVSKTRLTQIMCPRCYNDPNYRVSKAFRHQEIYCFELVFELLRVQRASM